jgi:hypothetical protein
MRVLFAIYMTCQSQIFCCIAFLDGINNWLFGSQANALKIAQRDFNAVFNHVGDRSVILASGAKK